MKNVVGVERPTDDPFPLDAKELDAVITVLNCHDFVWQKADTAKLNKKVFATLKKGGRAGSSITVSRKDRGGATSRRCIDRNSSPTTPFTSAQRSSRR